MCGKKILLLIASVALAFAVGGQPVGNSFCLDKSGSLSMNGRVVFSLKAESYWNELADNNGLGFAQQMQAIHITIQDPSKLIVDWQQVKKQVTYDSGHKETFSAWTPVAEVRLSDHEKLIIKYYGCLHRDDVDLRHNHLSIRGGMPMEGCENISVLYLVRSGSFYVAKTEAYIDQCRLKITKVK